MRRNRKTVLMSVLLAAVLICFVLLSCGNDRGERLRSNEARVAWLSKQGWEVEQTPVMEQRVILPESFPPVLEEYNELQKAQGFDLKRCAGKEVEVYTYRVTNYPGESEVYCCLYLHRSRVVAGDVHAAAVTGFMTGILRENP